MKEFLPLLLSPQISWGIASTLISWVQSVALARAVSENHRQRDRALRIGKVLKAMASLAILLIEDDSGDAMLTQMALEEQNFSSTLSIARTGQEGIAFLQQSISALLTGPDLVLLDGALSDAPGLDILRTIKESPQLARIPVVMLTGSSNPSLQAQFIEHGAKCVIEKSGDFDALIERLSCLPSLMAA